MTSTMPGLNGEIVRSGEISGGDRDSMHALMAVNFHGLDRDGFDRDLAAKPWTILLRERAGDIAGFSTLDIMTCMVHGRAVHAVYSGDTIIAETHRATTALPRAFLRFLSRHTGFGHGDEHWYWFYVCKGYRTYRFLPVFYHTYYPHPVLPTPEFDRLVMNQLARLRFGMAYDAGAGVVRVPGDYSLREGVGDISDARMADPHVRLFADRNPGWRHGEELVCLAPLHRRNFRAKPLQWFDQEVMG